MSAERLIDLLMPQDEHEEIVVRRVAAALDERSLAEFTTMVEREIAVAADDD